MTGPHANTWAEYLDGHWVHVAEIFERGRVGLGSGPSRELAMDRARKDYRTHAGPLPKLSWHHMGRLE